MKYIYTPPLVVTKLFKDFTWNSSCNKVLLTFDDGPTEIATETILQTLSQYNIKAIFFCVGNNVQKYPQLVYRILEEGHTIGNHTFNHKRLTTISNDEGINEIDSFNNLVKNNFNYDVKYFRPPHGRFTISTQKILAQKNINCVMWSLLTEDYKNNFETVKFAVTNYLKNNSIVVLHDSVKSADIIKDSIRFIYDEINRKGYTLGEPAECLRPSSLS